MGCWSGNGSPDSYIVHVRVRKLRYLRQYSADRQIYRTYVQVRVGSGKSKTAIRYGFAPVYEQMFEFKIRNTAHHIQLKLKLVRQLYKRLMGVRIIPLSEILARPGHQLLGEWYRLHRHLVPGSPGAGQPAGSAVETGDQVQLDIRVRPDSD